MVQANTYTDLRGRQYFFASLDGEEKKLIARLKRRITTHGDWYDYENYWIKTVGDFYLKCGLSRKEVTETALWKIAQDLGSRLAIKQGLMRAPDYRDELDALIREKFKTHREFCKATGISEDMLSHVLSRRKHLAIDTLEAALEKIGCTLRIVPLPTEFIKASK